MLRLRTPERDVYDSALPELQSLILEQADDLRLGPRIYPETLGSGDDRVFVKSLDYSVTEDGDTRYSLIPGAADSFERILEGGETWTPA